MYWHHARRACQIFFISNFLSKISVFRHFFKFEWSDRSHIAYLDRSYQYLQLLYWHYILQVSQKIFISTFLSKISVFRHFFKFECSDRSHIAYLDRSYQYLQLSHWHHVRQVYQIFFISNFLSNFSVFRHFLKNFTIKGMGGWIFMKNLLHCYLILIREKGGWLEIKSSARVGLANEKYQSHLQVCVMWRLGFKNKIAEANLNICELVLRYLISTGIWKNK